MILYDLNFREINQTCQNASDLLFKLFFFAKYFTHWTLATWPSGLYIPYKARPCYNFNSNSCSGRVQCTREFESLSRRFLFLHLFCIFSLFCIFFSLFCIFTLNFFIKFPLFFFVSTCSQASDRCRQPEGQ